MLDYCQRCKLRRTSKPLCEWCQKQENARARTLKKYAAKAGTAANLGSDAFLDSIPAPDGWMRDRAPETWPGQKPWPQLTLAGDGIEIRIVIINLDDEYYIGSGHTSFKTAQGERTFDRTGVEDSFYVKGLDTASDVAATIAEQIARVAKSRERIARSEPVPGLPGGWIVTPETKAEIAAKLRAGRSHSFTPAGFGTGYCVSTRRTRFTTPLPGATARFFGVETLYYETLDCD